MATIYDVARAAGVSAKTVSRVLNGAGPVSERTRVAVEAAMDELSFVPSRAAQSMRGASSGLVGLITGAISTSPDLGRPAGLPDILIVQGVQQRLSQAGLTLIIGDTGHRTDRVPHLVRTFLRHRVEGLIYVADHHQKVALPVVPDGTPLVLANCFDGPDIPAVLPDDRRGQQMLTARILAAGHRRIGFLTLREELAATRLRLDGYRDALEAAGQPFDPALVRPCDLEGAEAEPQVIWDAIDRMLALPDPPTVLMCGNDLMAMRVYGILRSRGVRVPEDVSVAGYDNHRAIAETLYPALTTAELPYGAIGARAAERLLALIRGGTDDGAMVALVSGPIHWRGSVLERRAARLHHLRTVRED